MTTGRINQVASLLERRFESSRSESPRVDASLDNPCERRRRNAGPAATAEPRNQKAHGRENESRDVLKRFDTHDVPTSVNARGFAHVVVEKLVA